MAVIAPQPNSSKWYAVVGIGLGLIAPHIMIHSSYLQSSVMTFSCAYELPSPSSQLTSSSEAAHGQQVEADTVYVIPQNLGLPNRREPGGTR